jgi:deoxycytidylate deaminase
MNQIDLFETNVARSMLDQLLEDSRLYKKGPDYQNLLDFVVRLRNFAPFNAMLLQVQKPGVNHVASARDWHNEFNRTIKDGARPLLILWPFGPVALVYDVMDTDGEPLPQGVFAFTAHGAIDESALGCFAKLLTKKGIEWNKVDAGDRKAGSIERLSIQTEPKEPSRYRININKNHDPNVQFATLAHELGHLFLGHLKKDIYLKVPVRPTQLHVQRELEAESVAHIVCARNGVENKSASYLTDYVKQDTTTNQIDLYQVMRAAGQIETLLGLTVQIKYNSPQKPLYSN